MAHEPAMEERCAALAAELEACSDALEAALLRRDPLYLEHFEKRQRLVRELHKAMASSPGLTLPHSVRERLERAHGSGARSVEEARKMGDRAREEIVRLHSLMSLASSLRPQSPARGSILNLRG